MSRVELLEQLCEAWDTLPEDVRAEVALLAATDPEMRQAMEFSRTLSAVSGPRVYPEPSSSDASFLVAVRNRISRRTVVGYAKLLPNARGVAIAASACVMILVAVIVGGRIQAPTSITEAPQAPVVEMKMSVAADDDAAPISVDSLANAGVDALELAAYLNVSDVAEQVIDTLDGDSLPLTDELLALDVGTLEEVLDDLEATSFF